MTFRIIWLHAADEDLAFVYLAATELGQAAAVTAACAEIERRIARNPLDEGESREGADRLVLEPPVSIIYEPVEDAWAAVVKSVRYIPPRGR